MSYKVVIYTKDGIRYTYKNAFLIYNPRAVRYLICTEEGEKIFL